MCHSVVVVRSFTRTKTRQSRARGFVCGWTVSSRRGTLVVSSVAEADAAENRSDPPRRGTDAIGPGPARRGPHRGGIDSAAALRMPKTTWKPHTRHGQLDEADRDNLPDTVYAFFPSNAKSR